ncbi:MAG: class I SAM-dependent methyltransferase [Provencibacterium sp.]|jgi:SAM-dependent methyltransferase|nr:class I SAM-dependent methyltransferase [Provencibacterium sp.]
MDLALIGNEHEVPESGTYRVYDLQLLRRLNEEYREKPLMSSFTQYDDASQLRQAKRRIESLGKKAALEGKRILEVGCGGGYVAYELAKEYGCQVTGIDIYQSEVWERLSAPSLQYRCIDLSRENPFEAESFDLIVSYVAWEHMRHPFEVLQQCVKLMKRGGLFYLYANLYRSALASHLYRHIFFPYPQLLFDDSVLLPYVRSLGVEQWWIDAFYYVNKLTYAEYKQYFELLHLKILKEEKALRNLDWDFYERFEDKLGLYPVSDLELDFFGVLLQREDVDFVERQRIMMQPPALEGQGPYFVGTAVRAAARARGRDLKFAWYVFHEGKRIYTQWYTQAAEFEFVPQAGGKYQLLCFAMDSAQNKKSVYSPFFEVLTSEGQVE